jgi:hypothetical protein
MARDGTKTGGRSPGTPNKVTAATRARIMQELDPIGFLGRIMNGEGVDAAMPADKNQPTTEPPALIYPTLDQQLSAARVLADKIVATPKSRSIRLKLPPIKTAADVLAALGEVTAAMARGKVTLDECQMISGSLELHRKAIETADIEARLAALEAERAKKER